MEAKTESTVAKTAYGKTLDKPINYSFSWDNYSNHAEVVAANDGLTEKEIVDVRNAERKAAARQAALTAALTAAGIQKPTLENDPQFRLQQMVKILEASGKSTAEARDLASVTLGLEWAE